MGTAPEYQRKMLDAVVVLEGVQALRREAAAVAAAARDTCESSQALRAEATQAGRHAAAPGGPPRRGPPVGGVRDDRAGRGAPRGSAHPPPLKAHRVAM